MTSRNSIENQLNAVFNSNVIFEPQKHISAFSNPLIPIITSENKTEIQLGHWGLIPSWIQSLRQANEIRKLTYNAKSETINEKSSFRGLIKNKKCLIIADGFYEWQSTPTGKICHHIRHSENDILTLGGIWSDWIDKSTGESITSLSIMTQKANKTMEKIHNVKKRQPIIIDKNYRQRWFDSKLNYEIILDASFKMKLKNKIVSSPLKRDYTTGNIFPK